MSSDVQTTGAALHAVIRRSVGQGDRLYGVIDAARDNELVQTMRDRLKLDLISLFKDGTSKAMADVAPYLFEFQFRGRYPYPGSDFLNLWSDRLGGSIGILIVSPADPTALKSHLQNLFHVEDVDGKPYYFRFYDPRVIRIYFPTCSPEDGREFFGPMNRVLVESDQPNRVLSCSAQRTGVNVDDRELVTTKS